MRRYLDNYVIVRDKIIDLEARDKLRNWQPPVDGNMIMATFGLSQGKAVGEIKTYVRETLLNSDSPNDFDYARRLMLEKGRELGYEPIENKL